MYMLDLYEHVMESAQFEIDNGNTEYTTIFEEAEAAANKENTNWFKKFISNAKNFVKSIIQKVRMVFNKLKVASVQKKTEKLIKTMGEDKQGKAISYDSNEKAKVYTLSKRALESSSNIKKDIEMILNGEKPSNYENTNMTDEEVKTIKRRPGVNYPECKELLDSIIKSVNQLNQNIDGISNIASKYSDKSASEIRIAISSVYSTCAGYISKLFKLVKDITDEYIKYGSEKLNDLNDEIVKHMDNIDNHKKNIDELLKNADKDIENIQEIINKSRERRKKEAEERAKTTESALIE